MKGNPSGGPDVYRSRSVPNIDAERPAGPTERTPQEQRQAELAEMREQIKAGNLAGFMLRADPLKEPKRGEKGLPTQDLLTQIEEKRVASVEAGKAARRRLNAMGMTSRTSSNANADPMAVAAAQMMRSPTSPQ